MARERLTRTIDRKDYTILQLPPPKALPIYTWLVGVLGKAAPDIAGSLENAGDLSNIKDIINNGDLNIQKLFKGLGSAVIQFDDPRTVDHVETLLSEVKLKGKEVKLDSPHFQGKMLHLTKVIIACLEVNFSDFLGGSGDKKEDS